jgi:hypothetical protein
MPDFDLRELAIQHLEQPGELHRDKVVRELLNAIPPQQREAALEQTLPVFVMVLMSQWRRRTVIRPGSSRLAESAGSRPPSRSAKRERIAAWWRRALEERYATSENGMTKPLGDMDRDDLLFAAKVREVHAARTVARAAALRGLVELLDEHTAKRVRDLPEAVLVAVLVDANEAA